MNNLNQRVLHLVKSGTITNKINTQGQIHTCQVSSFQNQEVHNNRPIYGHWGFTSVPSTGSQCMTLSGYGLNNNKFIFSTHDINTHPTNLQEGEVQIYDKNKQSLYLSVNVVEVTANDLFEVKLGDNVLFSISKDKITINIDIEVNGEVKATGEITSGSIALTQHKHSGVQAGSSETSGPV